MGSNRTFRIDSLAAMDALAGRLAQALRPGDVVALNGPMGAGKTTLVQRLGGHLGVNETIASPTFALVHEYLSGRVPLAHVDFYRLGPGGASSLAEELLAMMAELQPVLVAEWADYAGFLSPVLTLRILPPENTPEAGTESRTIEAWAAREDLLNALAGGDLHDG